MKNLLQLTLILLLFAACKTKEVKQVEYGTFTELDKPYLSYQGAEDKQSIVLVGGDEEYRSEESLPQLARILSSRFGFNCKVLLPQSPDKPGLIDPNYLHNIPGLETLKDADLMIIATRFRELPDGQMQHINEYLEAGGAVIGLRTATHAFRIQDTTSNWLHYGNYYAGEKPEWHGGFGRLVLGEKWISHHGHHKHQSTRGIIPETAAKHPITQGIAKGDIWASTDVYGVRLPLPGDAKPLVLGQVINRPGEIDNEDLFFGMRATDADVATKAYGKREYHPNDPMMPIAWVKTYQLPEGKAGRAFTTTMGSSSDLLSEGVRRLIINAAHALMGLDVDPDADVALVGRYEPTQYSFQDDQYWVDKGITLDGLRSAE